MASSKLPAVAFSSIGLLTTVQLPNRRVENTAAASQVRFPAFWRRRVAPHLCCDGGPPEKSFRPEPSFEQLGVLLHSLPQDQQRAALSVVGLAFGDAVGLPFELGKGIYARARFHAVPTVGDRASLAKELMLQRCLRRGRTPFFRTYSDDTACCDLKMEAAAQAAFQLNDCPPSVGKAERVLQRATLQQYLKWAHGTQRNGRGALFQGYGAFTIDFLVPKRNNAVSKALGQQTLFEDHDEFGQFCPTSEFTEFATAYFRGEHGFPSWGNGAVMSLAPHPILMGKWRAGEFGASRLDLQLVAPVFSSSHLEPTAVLGSELLSELLTLIYGGTVLSSANLRSAFLNLPSVQHLFQVSHECIPVVAFREWLEKGDCEVATAQAFLKRLTGSNENFPVAAGRYGVFGEMLHIASDWDNDHNLQGREKLTRAGSAEPVFFSQRGLNSVIIAVWSAAGSRLPWEFMDRVIYVGGDTDTVGAVAGQITCPLLDSRDVLEAFAHFVALERSECPDDSLAVANAAARRLVRRAILFASGDLASLLSSPSLLDPCYPPLVDESGEFVQSSS
eukprot:TRINITY_DN21404_c0_g2_i1.p1 TRINITY_DN21404_c0_g2~~TRINITY_DN21404_c0_g2_i1.p1  ORF type:complete len:584 (+),score=62.92 TRINITY_DN21404_c0_g2_i1:72-1754(+)